MTILTALDVQQNSLIKPEVEVTKNKTLIFYEDFSNL